MDRTLNYERHSRLCRVRDCVSAWGEFGKAQETVVGKNYMTIPDYLDILYSVKY